MNWPGATVRRRSMAGAPSPSTSSVCSIMTTASAPRGTMPPVAIVVAEPGDTSSAGAWPQTITSPLSGKRRGAMSLAPAVSAERNAKPSTLARSNGGTSIGAVTSCASTRPSASLKLTISCGSGDRSMCRAKRARASSARDHFEELFLSRGAADRGDEIALDRFWFETCGHGQGLIMTSVGAGYPSLSGAIKIHPLAWASAESGT